VTARRQLGPETRRALAAPIDGSKRRKALLMVAAFIDAGRSNPSISELAARARLRRLAVVAIVDRLEREGWLEVERCKGQHNRYTLLYGRQR
jgi:DNA-binding MarR family transcriptional regulator